GILAERALCEPSQGAMFDQRELGTAWRDELAAFRAKLDPVNRGIFDAYLDDLSHEEVAEVFGLPGANASTQRMKRIRAALQTERNAALAKGLQAAREANYAGGDGSLTATLVGPDGESEFDIEAPQARWHADGYLRVDLTLSTDPGVPNMVGIALLQPSDRLAPAPTAPFVLRWEPAGATFRARLEAFLGKPPFHDLSGDGVQWPLDRLELALAS
ncbi:MAG: sigma-70 family RNA polymerase sigma factor, partial [Planctomycetes bacterium]|nr:sigma-70 family RNA polymerase sigma factor [Planctomycetota bacterium]